MVKKKRKTKEHIEASNQTDENKPASFDSVAVLDEVCNNDEVNQPEPELPTISISELDNTEEDKVSVLTYRSKGKSVVSTEHTVEDNKSVELTEVMNNVMTVNGESETTNISVDEVSTGKDEASNQNTLIKNICKLFELIPVAAQICRICVASTLSLLIVFNIKCYINYLLAL